MSDSITLACDIIQQGGVIAYPTEAVWGLGCDPFNQQAVEKILGLKQRDPEKGLILVAAKIEQFESLLIDISNAQREQLEQTWPGPYTWLVPHNDLIPSWVTGQFTSVALRVSAHPLIQTLCTEYGGPIVSTSANPQGESPARSADKVKHYFQHDKRLDFITEGEVGESTQPTEIRDLITGKQIRAS